MATDIQPPAQRPATRPIPLLRNGDRLTSDEFLRRYEAMPGVKAELVGGRVYLAFEPVLEENGETTYMASPVRHRQHGKPHFNTVTWLGNYVAATPGTDGGDNSTLRLDLGEMPQPDAFLRVLPEHGGQARDTADGYVAGGPELVAEVAASSVNYDLHEKLDAYGRHGVREYVVWRVEDEAIDWFALRDGRYEPLAVGEDGVIRSEVFPGLWLDAAAMLRGDLATVLAALQRGTATAEHAAFAERLRTAAADPR